ncbi:MAG: NAD(P)H-binding protein [Bacteroidota bacterium]
MQVSVLGCGWLGLPLAKMLIGQGYAVKGSTTSPDKLSILSDAGIVPYIIDLNNPDANDVAPFLEGSELLIINIPPGRKTATVPYPEKMQFLLPHIISAGIKKVLFVSSTSVYADGFPFPVITENMPTVSENTNELLEAEQVFVSSNDLKTTIVRFSGLVGAGRHPVHHLSGRKDIANPDAPVNLIDLSPACLMISRIIEREAWNQVFLGADANHPTREAYYAGMAKTLGLALPEFSYETPSVGKIISSEKAERVLGISLSGTI